MPYQTGIEIECHCSDPWKLDTDLRKIDGIIENNSDSKEIRFRVAAGINGMIALEAALGLITKICMLNPGSGIHYHIDCRESFYDVRDYTYKISREDNWILKALDSWNYQGKYNSRSMGERKTHWVRICPTYETLEFRIGEMTFNYAVILKRIISAQAIVRGIKKLSVTSPKRTKSNLEKKQQIRKIKKLRYRMRGVSKVRMPKEASQTVQRLLAGLSDIEIQYGQ